MFAPEHNDTYLLHFHLRCPAVKSFCLPLSFSQNSQSVPFFRWADAANLTWMIKNLHNDRRFVGSPSLQSTDSPSISSISHTDWLGHGTWCTTLNLNMRSCKCISFLTLCEMYKVVLFCCMFRLLFFFLRKQVDCFLRLPDVGKVCCYKYGLATVLQN